MTAEPRPAESTPQAAHAYRAYSRFEDVLVIAEKHGAASSLAWALWSKAILWANLRETDGRIGQADLVQLMPDVALGRYPGLTVLDVAAELVRRQLFDPDGDGWVVHDFLIHNRSKEQRAEAREMRHAAARKGGAISVDGRPRDALGRLLASPTSPSPDSGNGIANVTVRALGHGPSNMPGDVPSNMDGESWELPEGWDEAWEPFLEVWRERGLNYLPSEAQRRALWTLIDARPNDAIRWLHQAPKGVRVFEMVAYLLNQAKAAR
jgi:hypothetical protein